MCVLDQIDELVDGLNLGMASAAKRGRNSAFPYVPVIKRTSADGIRDTTQNPTRRAAYATREEAVAVAQRHIDAQREATRTKLKQPGTRAWRKSFGLPEEI
jgi:hypothetical protein